MNPTDKETYDPQAGWLNNWENDKISDADLEDEVNEILNNTSISRQNEASPKETSFVQDDLFQSESSQSRPNEDDIPLPRPYNPWVKNRGR